MAEEEPEDEPARCPFQEEFDGEMVVASIVGDIVDSAYEIIKEHYIKDRLPAYAADCALKDLFDVVRTGYLSRDAGDEDAPTASEWIAEEEPDSSSLDTWARGRVKVMTKPKEEEDDRTEDARRMSRMRGRALTSAGGARKKRETQFGGESLTKVMEAPPGSPREEMSFKAFKTRGRDEENPAVEAAHAKQIQLLEAAEKKVRDKKAKKKQIVEDEKNMHESLMKELKGKEYTFHAGGEVVVISPPAYDSLAPVTTTPRINITAEEQLLKSDESSKSLRKKQKKKKRNRKKGPEDDDPQYKEDESLQPSMMNTVVLVGGVDLKEGDKERRGPPVEPDHKHMNRAEYMAQSAPPPEAVPMVDPSANLLELEAAAQAEAAAAAAAAALLAAEEPELVDISEVLIQEEDLVPYPPEVRLDANMEMVQADNWGVNPVNTREYIPPSMPKKPNTKQRQLTAKMTGGERVKNPRDRPFITASPRKKLPAPPLGKTTGHGHPTSGHPLSSSSLGFNIDSGLRLPTLAMSPLAHAGLAVVSPTPAPKNFKTYKQQMGGGQVARTDVGTEILKALKMIGD